MTIQDKMAAKNPNPKRETKEITFEEFLHAILSDIDPAKHAGEGWYATDEYARPEDIQNPWTRATIGKEEEYYPGLMAKMRKQNV